MQVLNFLPFVVWYVLPGLNLIFFCILIPMLVLDYDGTLAQLSPGDLTVALTAAIVLGFIMDSVKLYRLSRGYRKQKAAFFKKLAEALDLDEDIIPNVFDIIRADVRSKDPSSRTVELEHSRWVMINHSSKALFVAAAIWVAIGASHLVSPESVRFLGLLKTSNVGWQIAIDTALALASLLTGLRLQAMAYAEADASDMNYLLYVRNNADRLREEITRPLKQPGAQSS